MRQLLFPLVSLVALAVAAGLAVLLWAGGQQGARAGSSFPADAIDVQTDTILPEDDLLFSSIRYLPEQPPAGESWRPDVYAMDVETLQYHRITFMSDQVMRHMAASPDRRKLAITRIPDDTNGDTNIDEHDDQIVWIVDLQAGKAWPLTEADASAGVGGVDWLDNETVVFNYRPPGAENYDLAKANYLTKARTMLTNTPTIGETDVSASADGTMLAYIAVDSTEVLGTDEFGPILKGKVWLMNADGTNRRQITDGGPLIGRVGLLGAGDYDPELSPDHSKVTFGRAVELGTNDLDPLDGIPPAGTHQIYSADVNTLAVTELTQNSSVALIPDWADDGTIYFSEVAVTAEHGANKYLGIATTTESGGLTRLEPFPLQEIWKGALVTKLIPPDGDGDGVPDAADDCPANPDCDGDGFSDGIEVFVGTLPLAACPATVDRDDEEPDAWPPDWDDSQTVDLPDLLPFKPHYGATDPSDPLYDPRYDLNADGAIDLLDLLPFKAFFNLSCA